MDDVVLVAVPQGLQNLPHVMAKQKQKKQLKLGGWIDW